MNSKMFDHWKPVVEILAAAAAAVGGDDDGGGSAGLSICSEWGRTMWAGMWWMLPLWLLWDF